VRWLWSEKPCAAAISASGNGGQTVLVIRELDMVIATWGGNYSDRAGWTMVRENVPRYVLAAVKDPAR